MPDPFHLERFVEAQAGIYDTALSELTNGRKMTHWMWFVFPQLAGLGLSAMAQSFAISGKAEAAAYLAHPLLGARLLECTQAVNAVSSRTAHEIFGSPDDLKFRSSMTLFEIVAVEPASFRMAIDRFFGGEPDRRTLALLAGG
ncbi:MAG TPA: DUF1810 domain-containing protein [Pararhizobium sp.]|uniref:DUF1810 domain-containing protein n=1 Tax=Pararhizobium sp. TaxID=1977563 RepID=UPI002C80BDA6|nr:DUF1810 domain-containing protein [Pararhizobium sp.]HTO33331.1 DUF1810 domain-containing protein [Pararhizobium sp.]